MSDPRYTTPEYRAEKRRLRPIVARGEAQCVEPVCLMASRWIAPGSAWDLSHDRATGGLLGPSHFRCNRAEGGREKHKRARGVGRWAL